MTNTKQIRFSSDKQGVARIGDIHIKQVDEIAARTGESRNEVVRRAIITLYAMEKANEKESGNQ